MRYEDEEHYRELRPHLKDPKQILWNSSQSYFAPQRNKYFFEMDDSIDAAATDGDGDRCVELIRRPMLGFTSKHNAQRALDIAFRNEEWNVVKSIMEGDTGFSHQTIFHVSLVNFHINMPSPLTVSDGAKPGITAWAWME